MWFNRRLNRGRFWRAATAIAALVAYVVTTIGYPLPVVAGAVASHECLDHVCHCSAAAREAGQCCCASGGAAAKIRSLQPTPIKTDVTEPTSGSCCSSKAHSSPSSTHVQSTDSVLHDLGKFDGAPVKHNSRKNPNIIVVSSATSSSPKLPVVSAPTCRGITTLWVSLGAVFSPPAVIDLNLSDTMSGQVAILDQTAAGRSIRPLSPPPK